MAIYVRSTDGSDSDDGSTWALAKASLTGAAAIDVAGDVIYLSQSHAESTAAAVTLDFAGTLAAPTKVICANDAAEPPTTSAESATVTTTGANNIKIKGKVLIHGVTFNIGTGSSSAGLYQTENELKGVQIYEKCKFKILNTGSSSAFIFVSSAGGNAYGQKITWRDCDVLFSGFLQAVRVQNARFRWVGGALLTGGDSPDYLIKFNNSCHARLENIDLSNADTDISIFYGEGSDAVVDGIIRSSKLPNSWAGNVGVTTGPYQRFEMHECASGADRIRLRVADYAGTIADENTIIRTGGANDGTAYSWKLSTSANALYPTIPLTTPELPAKWNDTTGSAVAVSVEVLHDSLTALNDDEIWLEVTYLPETTKQGETVSDGKASYLVAATAQASSSAEWTTTGLMNPNKQKLSVTITPQSAGYIQARVHLAKASTTVYVDPKLTVA